MPNRKNNVGRIHIGADKIILINKYNYALFVDNYFINYFFTFLYFSSVHIGTIILSINEIQCTLSINQF